MPHRALLAAVVTLALCAAACQREQSVAGAPKASSSASGTLGRVRGVVKIEGKEPEALKIAAKIPPECPAAQNLYARKFREGPGRTVADALVTVTHWSGKVPPPTKPLLVEIDGCAFGSRTFAAHESQDILVKNLDERPYIPFLTKTSAPANLVAVPKGDPVKLFPKGPGRYGLEDTTRDFLHADLFVLKYPTFDVTGVDGSFDVEGIPAGKVRVSALLPVLMATTTKEVVVEAGQVTEVELRLHY